MDKEAAAQTLGISVRSLQRLVQSEKLSVTYKRGDSGKQEAIFNPEEIENFKYQRDVETTKPANVTTSDMLLARNVIDPTEFFNVLRDAIIPQPKVAAVAVADKPLLKLDEASALTGLSKEFLKKAIKSDELQGRRIGNPYRIKREDLDDYIKRL